MLTFRPLAAADIDAILAIQTASPETAQWSAEAWRSFLGSATCGENDLLQCGYCAWVAEQNDKIAGFLAGLLTGEELEIMNVAVAPAERRAGAATGLLETAFKVARRVGGKRAFLEVRISNAGAIAFYERHGFSASGRRAGYYSAPVEDALLLSRMITESEEK